MSAHGESERYFLYVGQTKTGLNKLYIGKGSFDDEVFGWRQAEPVKVLSGITSAEVLEAAITRALELFDSAEDLLKKGRSYTTDWTANSARAATEGPKPLFIVDPWGEIESGSAEAG